MITMLEWSSDQAIKESKSFRARRVSLSRFPSKKEDSVRWSLMINWWKFAKCLRRSRTGLQASLRSEVFENLALSWASDRSSRIIIALRGNILWYDDEKNGVNLVAKINRCVKMEIPRPSNTVGPPSPSPPPAIERDLAETYEIKLIEEYTIRRAADIKIEFITF